MYNQQGRFVRTLLVDLYFCDHLSTNLVDRIINEIASFVKETKNQHIDHRLIDF